MTKRIIAVAGALALAAGAANAGDTKLAQSGQGSSPSTPGMNAPPASGEKGASTPKTGANASGSVSGDVQAVDVSAMAITIVGPAGEVQRLVIATDAPITRDGSNVSLDQVKQGDNVRASFDPATRKASRIDVKSKESSKGTSKDTSPSK